jgi:hypothetical protein
MTSLYKFSSHLTENTQYLHHEAHPVNVLGEIIAAYCENFAENMEIQKECVGVYFCVEKRRY